MQTMLPTCISTFKDSVSQNYSSFEEPVSWQIYVIKIPAKCNLKEPNFKKIPGGPGGMPPDPLAFSMLYTMPITNLVLIHYCHMQQASKIL